VIILIRIAGGYSYRQVQRDHRPVPRRILHWVQIGRPRVGPLLSLLLSLL